MRSSPIINLLNRKMSSVALPKIQKAIIIDGVSDGYDVIKYKDIATPTIQTPNDIIIKNKYAGVNYIESYFRKGIYPCALPAILGREASGVVVDKGTNIKNFEIGDKVAYIGNCSMAQFTKIDNSMIMKLSSDSTNEDLKLYAAGILQGLTALSFVTEAYEVKKGDYILVYAAAGGAGLIFDQLIKARGAHVIAVCSSDEKLQLAKENGAEYLINSKTDDILTKVMEITDNKGVQAAFDSVGKDTFHTTLAALKNKGTFVSFGNASGPVPPIKISLLTPKNIKLLRPSLYAYTKDPEDWNKYTTELFSLIQTGALKIKINDAVSLEKYAELAKKLESRSTTGKFVLEIPQ
ncbi:NADPH:quinone reductase NDAI_0A06320 [Naumovozyma dairenensis CBS 421]|uniref:Probable quinone oxidoreductase n=1 Tax=Naumovozyma dairenensis (strain ATCC 10597 / BCRC 20456 / CBS 421 / NBRC 0211 / NRRL Y-12639) TaxID=1071378 RepID=G0W4P8_NAUDC|nr:hypothetical protein NDAI_0A06320 [Naumovozyma dairenensis CBS 421]CCD22786.1 hypothetical protein NDAI_0A06320 [Naumovozyma dairenensis CBS 421]